jgi:hypothetical protein
MIIAKRKLSSVLAAAAVLTCLLDNRVLAAPNDADDVRTAVAGFATSWNGHDMDAFGKLTGLITESSRTVRRSSTRLMFASRATTSPSLTCTGSYWAIPERRTHGAGCSCLCSLGGVARGCLLWLKTRNSIAPLDRRGRYQRFSCNEATSQADVGMAG